MIASTILLLSMLQAPAQPPLVLRSTTRLVQVSVVATRNGAPAEGLKKEDFVLTDNGKPQTISVFTVESSSASVAAAPSPPNTFTNRPVGTPSAVTIILLDALNTRFTDRAFAHHEIVKYLKSIEPGEHVGVYALGSNGIRILHDYTSTARELLSRLEKDKSGERDELRLDAWLRDRGMSFFTRDRVAGTLRALQFIADHLAKVPGRKNLIWVSAGFPLWGAGEDFAEEVAQSGRALSSASLAIYPVDARGLRALPEFAASVGGWQTSGRQVYGKVLYPWSPQLLPVLPRSEDTMRALAEQTGGRAYINTNDLAQAIRDAVADSRLTYTLGYYPGGEKFDGKFHSIAVTVRQPGVALRYRKGYFAFPEQPRDEKTRKGELQAAMFSPLEATEIPLAAERKPVAGRPAQLELLIRIEPQAVSFESQGDRMTGQLDILFMQKDESGRLFNGGDDILDLRLSPERYRQVMRFGLAYRKIIELGAGAAQVRVVVRDVVSGSVGSLTVPLR